MNTNTNTNKQRQVDYFPLTKYQKGILTKYTRDLGYGEGVVRLHKRLLNKYGSKRHFAIDDQGNIAMFGGKPFEESDDFKKRKLTRDSYTYKTVEYKYLVYGEQFEKKYRQLLPSKRAIQDFYRKDERVQRDAATRNNVAGGTRSPTRTSLKPVLTERVFDIVCMDSFRMPVAYREKDAKQENFNYKGALSGGSKAGFLYRWCFLVIDVHSKTVFLERIHQNGISGSAFQEVTKKAISKDNDQEDIDEADRASRPQSGATLRAFLSFVKRINEVRKWHHEQNKLDGPYQKIEPKLICHDNGSEFMGEFRETIQELNIKSSHKYYNETVTPESRSHYNGVAERAIKTIRKYFYSIYNAYREQVPDTAALDRRTFTRSNVPKPKVKWHVVQLDPGMYDWTLDIPEVLRRYNSSYHSVIRTTPINALLQRGITWKEIENRIWNYHYDPEHGRYRDVSHNLHLPGTYKAFDKNGKATEIRVHSEATPSYVRLKQYQPGDMNLAFSRDPYLSTKTRLKSATENFTKDIFIVTEMRKIVDPRNFYEEPTLEIPAWFRGNDEGAEDEQLDNLGPNKNGYSGRRRYQRGKRLNTPRKKYPHVAIYKVEHITPVHMRLGSRRPAPRSFLDRTQLIPIHSETNVRFLHEDQKREMPLVQYHKFVIEDSERRRDAEIAKRKRLEEDRLKRQIELEKNKKITYLVKPTEPAPPTAWFRRWSRRKIYDPTKKDKSKLKFVYEKGDVLIFFNDVPENLMTNKNNTTSFSSKGFLPKDKEAVFGYVKDRFDYEGDGDKEAVYVDVEPEDAELENNDQLWEVEKILRKRKTNKKGKFEYWVRWPGGKHKDSWVQANDLSEELIDKFNNKNARRSYEIGYVQSKKLKYQTFPAQVDSELEIWRTNKNIDFSKCICLYCRIDLEKTSDRAILNELTSLNKDFGYMDKMKEIFIQDDFKIFYE